MKKEYMKPTTKVVEIKRSMLLAGSLQMYDDVQVEDPNAIL